jgi:large subunit ribosomal protein L18
MKTLKRRRLERKTDYGKRLKLLKAGTPRVVVRKSNRYILAEYVTSREAQDKVELTLTSKKLLGYGWPKEAEGSLKSTPAAYFTGLLMGKTILKEKKETPIIDLGMTRIIHKSRLFGFIKGMVDAGIKIKHDAKTFPEKDRLEGKHLTHKIKFEDIKSKIEKL